MDYSGNDSGLVVDNRINLKNILKEVNGNHFNWATRFISFVNAYRDDNQPFLRPEQIKKIMLNYNVLYKSLDGVPENDIKEIINEIASSFSLPVVRWLGYILIKILSRTLSNLYVNEHDLIQIRNNMGTNPVIFLPTHRSYGDFILMAFICFHYNIQLPYVAAGMDFHSMRFMGEILRQCKAFFMRRTFADDHVYRTIFNKYFQLLIHLGESPIEFFIEGTRSRSAKSLPPKFGLLTLAIDSYLSGEVPDITLVPISISYDRILEEKLFAHELLGIPKPKESTMGMFNAFRKLEGDYGNVYFNFGQPIHVRDWINQNVVRKEKNVPNISNSKIINLLAHQIIQRQIDLQIMGVFNALAIIISYRVWSSYTYTIPLQEAVLEVQLICRLLKYRGGFVHIDGDFKQSLLSSCRSHSSLVDLTENHIILKKTFYGQFIDISALKGIFTEKSINEVMPIMMLQLYVNPCLHLLIAPALILYSLNPANKFHNGSVPEAFKYLSEIYKLEFVTLNNIDKQIIFEEGHAFLSKTGCFMELTTDFGPNKKLRSLLYHLLYPFVVGYKLLAHALVELPVNNIKWTANEIITCGQRVAKSFLDKGLLHPYCLSRDLMKNALDSFVTINYVAKYKENAAIYYIPNKKPLQFLINYLDISDIHGVSRPQKCRL